MLLQQGRGAQDGGWGAAGAACKLQWSACMPDRQLLPFGEGQHQHSLGLEVQVRHFPTVQVRAGLCPQNAQQGNRRRAGCQARGICGGSGALRPVRGAASKRSLSAACGGGQKPVAHLGSIQRIHHALQLPRHQLRARCDGVAAHVRNGDASAAGCLLSNQKAAAPAEAGSTARARREHLCEPPKARLHSSPERAPTHKLHYDGWWVGHWCRNLLQSGAEELSHMSWLEATGAARGRSKGLIPSRRLSAPGAACPLRWLAPSAHA